MTTDFWETKLRIKTKSCLIALDVVVGNIKCLN